LDTVDEDKSVLVGDELEVHSMDNGPDLPGSLACSKQVILDLASNGREGVSVHQSKIGEEDGHEEGAPEDLVDSNLQCNGLSVLALDKVIQPVVEVVSRWSMVKETESRESDEALHVEWSSRDENLCQEVTKGPANKRSESLSSQGVLVKSLVVGSPSWNGSTTYLQGIAEERTAHSRILAEGRGSNGLLCRVGLESVNREESIAKSE